jgi:hypothetical protein
MAPLFFPFSLSLPLVYSYTHKKCSIDIEYPQHSHKQTNKQTNKQANKQASKQASKKKECFCIGIHIVHIVHTHTHTHRLHRTYFLPLRHSRDGIVVIRLARGWIHGSFPRRGGRLETFRFDLHLLQQHVGGHSSRSRTCRRRRRNCSTTSSSRKSCGCSSSTFVMKIITALTMLLLLLLSRVVVVVVVGTTAMTAFTVATKETCKRRRCCPPPSFTSSSSSSRCFGAAAAGACCGCCSVNSTTTFVAAVAATVILVLSPGSAYQRRIRDKTKFAQQFQEIFSGRNMRHRHHIRIATNTLHADVDCVVTVVVVAVEAFQQP